MGNRKKFSKILHYLVMAALLSIFFFAATAAYSFIMKKYDIVGLSWFASAFVWSILSFFIAFIDCIHNEENIGPSIFFALLEAVQLLFISTVILYFFKFDYKIGFAIFIVYNLLRMIVSRHPLFDSSSRVVSVNRSQLLEGKKEEGLWVTDSLLDLEAMHRIKKEVRDPNASIPSKDYISTPPPVKKLVLDDSSVPGNEIDSEQSMPVSDTEAILQKEDKISLKVPHLKVPKPLTSETKSAQDETKAKSEEVKKTDEVKEAAESGTVPKVKVKKGFMKPIKFKKDKEESFQEVLKNKPVKEIRVPEPPPQPVSEVVEVAVPVVVPVAITPPEPVKLKVEQKQDLTLTMRSEETYEIPVDLTSSGVENIEEPLGPKIYSIMDSEDSIIKLFLMVRQDMSRIFNMKIKVPVEIEVESFNKGKQEENKKKLTDKRQENGKWIVTVTGSLTEDVTYGLLAANLADIWFEENSHGKVQDYRKGFNFWIAYKLLKNRGYENAAYQSTKQDMINFRKVRAIEKDFGEYGVFYYILHKEHPETMPGMFMKDTIPQDVLMELGKGDNKDSFNTDESDDTVALPSKSGFPFREAVTSKPSIKFPKKEKEKPEVIELDLAMTRFLKQEKPDMRRKPDKIISLETGDIVEIDKKK